MNWFNGSTYQKKTNASIRCTRFGTLKKTNTTETFSLLPSRCEAFLSAAKRMADMADMLIPSRFLQVTLLNFQVFFFWAFLLVFFWVVRTLALVAYFLGVFKQVKKCFFVFFLDSWGKRRYQ